MADLYASSGGLWGESFWCRLFRSLDIGTYALSALNQANGLSSILRWWSLLRPLGHVPSLNPHCWSLTASSSSSSTPRRLITIDHWLSRERERERELNIMIESLEPTLAWPWWDSGDEGGVSVGKDSRQIGSSLNNSSSSSSSSSTVPVVATIGSFFNMTAHDSEPQEIREHAEPDDDRLNESNVRSETSSIGSTTSNFHVLCGTVNISHGVSNSVGNFL